MHKVKMKAKFKAKTKRRQGKTEIVTRISPSFHCFDEPLMVSRLINDFEVLKKEGWEY